VGESGGDMTAADDADGEAQQLLLPRPLGPDVFRRGLEYFSAYAMQSRAPLSPNTAAAVAATRRSLPFPVTYPSVDVVGGGCAAVGAAAPVRDDRVGGNTGEDEVWEMRMCVSNELIANHTIVPDDEVFPSQGAKFRRYVKLSHGRRD
jgi:hypothetical protein